MKALHHIAHFLGAKRCEDLLELLASPDLAWQRPDLLGRTTAGRMWQLASPDMHQQPAVRQLAMLVYDEVTAALPDLLPVPSDLVPQVFPVRMDGNPAEPTTQMPHRDGDGGPSPIATTLYYAQVEDAVGGALALHDDSGIVRMRIQPATDELVVINGSRAHSVEPLTTGRTTTIVTNFYRAGEARDQVASDGWWQVSGSIIVVWMSSGRPILFHGDQSDGSRWQVLRDQASRLSRECCVSDWACLMSSSRSSSTVLDGRFGRRGRPTFCSFSMGMSGQSSGKASRSGSR